MDNIFIKDGKLYIKMGFARIIKLEGAGQIAPPNEIDIKDDDNYLIYYIQEYELLVIPIYEDTLYMLTSVELKKIDIDRKIINVMMSLIDKGI